MSDDLCHGLESSLPCHNYSNPVKSPGKVVVCPVGHSTKPAAKQLQAGRQGGTQAGRHQSAHKIENQWPPTGKPLKSTKKRQDHHQQ